MTTAIRLAAAAGLTVAALLFCGTAAAQACGAPTFETIQPEQGAAAGTPVSLGNLMRIELPGKVERLAFLPDSLSARLSGGQLLSLGFDDASLASRHNGLKGKAGPLVEGMLNGSTAAGCAALKTFKLEREDYRVKFTRGPLSVYAYGTGKAHNFFVIHKGRADAVVRGLAKDIDRQAFLDVISTIQPPAQE